MQASRLLSILMLLQARGRMSAAALAAKACGKQLQTLISDITLDVTIGGGGEVDDVVVRPPEKGTPEATCITTAVKALRFPRSRGGGEDARNEEGDAGKVKGTRPSNRRPFPMSEPSAG